MAYRCNVKITTLESTDAGCAKEESEICVFPEELIPYACGTIEELLKEAIRDAKLGKTAFFSVTFLVSAVAS